MALDTASILSSKKNAESYLSAGAVSRIRYEREQEAKAAAARAAAAAEADKDRGGVWGGLGYVGEKFAVGLVSSLEGIVDYTSAGVAKLFGADDWAEDVIANDWFGDWYSHPEEWYNPSKGWQVAGDVAGGIGTSIPGIAAAVGLTVATGGTAAPAAVKMAITGVGTGLVSGLGAAGRATKEAYEETGQLTGKEFGYGALTGVTEGGIEGISNLIGMGSGAVVKGFTKLIGRETAEAFAKQGVTKLLAKSFAGEAFEEAASEWLDPYWKRATYDKNAEKASLDEILYAGFVGGLSGMVMGGGGYALNNTTSLIKGNKLSKNGGQAEVIDSAGDIASFEEKNDTGVELFRDIAVTRAKLIESLTLTGGKVQTVQQKTMLGDLARKNVAAAGNMFVAKRAQNIIDNAPLIAERLTAYGYKRADGTPITYTAEQLTAGYDAKKPLSIYTALKNNEALRSLAIADATGQIMMDTAKFAEATLTGQRLASQVDLNRFLGIAKPEEVAAVSKALKIDDWNGLTAEAFDQKITDFINDGGVQRTLQEKERKSSFKAIPAESARPIPKLINIGVDGARRYSDGKLDIAVERKGDSYSIYDYSGDTLSRSLTRSEVNGFLREYNQNAKFKMQNAELTEGTPHPSAVLLEAGDGGNAKFKMQNAELTSSDGTSGRRPLQTEEGVTAGAGGNAELGIRNAEIGLSDGTSGRRPLQTDNGLIEGIKKFQSEVREIDSFARKNIKEYRTLNAPSQDMVNKVIREGRAKGLSDSDVLMYAKVSAHSGIDIQFDKEANYRGVKDDGSADYADGFYEAAKNRIVVNPEGKRTAERLLIHELDHAIRKGIGKDGATKIYLEAIEGVDQATRDRIAERYKKTAKPGESVAAIMDETNAYYAEQVLGNKNTLEKLIEAEPTLKDKILSFFKGASADYADVPKLSGAAKRYYRTYKKLFDEFSARNAGNNAMEPFTNKNGSNVNENGVSDNVRTINGNNMSVSDRQYAVEFNDKNEPFVVVEDDILSGVAEKEWINTVKRNLSSKYPNGIVLKNNTVVVNRQSRKEMTFSKYMSWLRANDPQAFSDKLRATNNSDEILNAASGWISEGLKHQRQDNIVDFARGNVLLRVGQNDYSASVIVGTQKNGTMLLYDIIDLKPTTITKKETFETIPVNPSQGVERKISNISDSSISQLEKKSNGFDKNSLENSSGKDFALDIDREVNDRQYAVGMENKVQITAEMSEEKRADIIEKQEISPAKIQISNLDNSIDWKALEENRKSIVAKPLIKKLRELGYLKTYKTEAIDIEFDFTASGLRKSMNSQVYDYGGTLGDLAKVVTHMQKLLDNSVLLEIHKDKAKGTPKENRQLMQTYVLLSAFTENNKISPVQFEIKQYVDDANRLYLAVALTKIETGVVDDTIIENNQSSTRLLPVSKYSIPQLIKKINPKDENFFKYIPNRLLTDEQKIAKQRALNKEAKKYGYDKEYSNKQYALPMDVDNFVANGEEFATPTLSTVGKERMTYKEKAFSKDWLFTKKTSAYIHAVDEMFGIQVYLEKVGGAKNAKASIQSVRSAPHQAQTMIGSVQYDIFKGNAKSAKKAGEGLNEIFRPIEKQGEKVTEQFNDYLLHQLNVDKYNANEKMKRLQEDAVESLHKVQEEIGAYEARKKEHEKRIFELGDTSVDRKLKEGNKKAIEQIDEKLTKLRADESELLLQMPMHAESELKLVEDRITVLMREEARIKQEIFEAGNDKDSMNKKRELREKSREIAEELERENEFADKLKETLRLYGYSLKPVFNLDGRTFTKEESAEYISKYDSLHPEFKATAEKVWKFSKNLNEMRVSSGLIARSFAQKMATMYPHYVPAFKSQINNSAKSDEGIAVSSTVKRAKGYNSNIMSVKESIASQVSQVARNGNINMLANKVYDTAVKTGDVKYVDIMLPEEDGAVRSEEGIDRPKPNTVSFFRDGKEYKMNVSDEIYLGFKGISEASAPHTNVFARAFNWITDKYKKLVTSWSPAFMIRNAFRDIQDAGLNSKHPFLFVKSIPKAWVEIANNSENWQTYRAYGGFSSTVFDSKGVKGDVGTRGFELLGISERIASGDKLSVKDVKYIKGLMKGVENINAVVEQVPRFAEYLASIQSGETIEQAIYNSAEVTTNFARRGATIKQLNSTIIPFLNPSIQGFDKIFRNFTDAARAGSGEEVAKAFGVLLAKAISIGMLPALFNSLMYDDDEDYKDLREEDKENNYLFKLPNGTFLKLPRGRVASVIAGFSNRTIKSVKGEDADWGGYVGNVVSQVTPVENLTRTIFSPFMDVANNRTWYGTEIEGAQFDNVRPKDRYDESTSSIAIAIGQAINYSPKKIHYLIDQYSGVIGDFLLPATTKKAEKDFFSGNFTLDPVTSNKLSNEFYKIYDEAQYSKTDGSVKAQYQVKYLNKAKSAISEMYNEINAIQNSDLSNYQKLQQTRVLRIMINEAMKNAVRDFEEIGKAIDATENMGFDDSKTSDVNIRYAEITRKVYGSERALYEYNSTVYSNMSVLNTAGISFDTLYDYYFGTKNIESDKDREGKTIAGSKRKKVVVAINGLGVSLDERLLLICASGYALKDGDVRGASAETLKKRLLKYILSMRLSAAEKAEIAEMCGFETKGGRIVYNFKKNAKKLSLR